MMLVATCAAACIGLAVGLAGTRPTRNATRTIEPDHCAPPAFRSATTAERITGAVRAGPEVAGRALRAATGRPADPVADRRVGVILIAVGAAVVIDVILVAIGLAAVLVTSRLRRLRRTRDHSEVVAVERDLPEFVDLLALAIAAGHTFPAAVPLVTRWAPPSLIPALEDLSRELDAGRPAAEAIELLGDRWGRAARPLLLTLRSHLRDGTPLADALGRVGDDARLRRQRAAETRSRRLPVLMLFPLVLCTLPAFGVLTVAPIVAGTLRSLTGEQLEAAASNPHQEEILTCSSDSPSYSPRSSPESAASCRALDAPRSDGRPR